MTEINQQTKLFSGCFQIINDLSPMLVHQLFYRFDFDDNLIKTHEIRFILMLQDAFFVFQSQSRFFNKRDLPVFHFNRQAFLINSLKKTVAFVFIHLKTSPDNLIAFLF